MESTTIFTYGSYSVNLLILAGIIFAIAIIVTISAVILSGCGKSDKVTGAMSLVAGICVIAAIATWVFYDAQNRNDYKAAAQDICETYGMENQTALQNDIVFWLGEGGQYVTYEDVFVSTPSNDGASNLQSKNIACDLVVESSPDNIFRNWNTVHVTMYEQASSAEWEVMEPVKPAETTEAE